MCDLAPKKESHGWGRYARDGGEREQLGEPVAHELQTPLAEGEAFRTSLSGAELTLQVSRNYPKMVCPWKNFGGALRCEDTKGMGER